MIERFRDLTTKQKIGAIALIIAFIGFVVFFFSGLSNQKTTEPTPEETTTSQSDPSETAEPDTEPVETAEPTPTSTATSAASEMPPIEFGKGSLSDEETINVQKAANTAIEQFLEWKSDESAAARKERISPYIAASSEVDDLAPDLRPAVSYAEKESGGVAQLAAHGSTEYLTAVGGDESRYRVAVGIVLRTQYNYDESASQKSSLIKKSSTITVDMTKENGTWKILEISAS